GIGKQKQRMSPVQKSLYDQLSGQEPRGHEQGIGAARPTGQFLFGQCIYLQGNIGFSRGAMMQPIGFHTPLKELQKWRMGLQSQIGGAPKIEMGPAIEVNLSAGDPFKGNGHQSNSMPLPGSFGKTSLPSPN